MKKVILLGDSIRQGYDKYVKLAFEGTLEVYYPKGNCRYTAFMLRNLAAWKERMECGSDVDLIHWNAGLWDCLHMIDGKPLTDIEVYKDYLGRIYTVLDVMFPGAKQIFATSVAVIEEGYTGEYKRYNRDIEAYNTAARQVLEPLGVQINDLYALTKDIPKNYYSDHMTHLYTEAGTRLLTEHVVSYIERSLDVRGQALDYSALFAEPTEIVGI